jgi:hypothetical protein
MATTNPDVRAAFIAGLLDLACFLEAHPDMPVPSYGTSIYVSTHGTDEEDERTVDLAAAVFGVPASWNGTKSHYDASRDFGPVEYQVGSITSTHMARHRAHQSYADVVQPDESPVAA